MQAALRHILQTADLALTRTLRLLRVTLGYEGAARPAYTSRTPYPSSSRLTLVRAPGSGHMPSSVGVAGLIEEWRDVRVVASALPESAAVGAGAPARKAPP